MRLVRAALATALAVLALSAGAQDNYLDHTVRLIARSDRGGNPDVTARLLGDKLGGAFGQAFVENVPGAGGIIAAKMVAKANRYAQP